MTWTTVLPIGNVGTMHPEEEMSGASKIEKIVSAGRNGGIIDAS